MKQTLIVMSAVVPTYGHKALIEFAFQATGGIVYVLVNTRKDEPYSGRMRVEAIRREFAPYDHVVVEHRSEDDMPETGSDDFWGYWLRQVREVWPNVRFDYVASSESYGVDLAKTFGAKFLPFDPSRLMYPVQGTDVREDMSRHWHDLLPAFREQLEKPQFVIFGAESTGKTTVAKMFATQMRYPYRMPVMTVPEYARSYLELVGPELTEEKMRDIVRGQTAVQNMASNQNDSMAAVFDTDLYSTLGYYQIMAEDGKKGYNRSDHRALLNQLTDSDESDLQKPEMYYILPDTAPFVPDQLRYGKVQRERDTAWWIKFAQSHKLPFEVLESGYPIDQALNLCHKIQRNLFNRYSYVSDYERANP